MDDKRKLSQGIFNPVSDGVQKLAQLFPSAVKDGEVDFNALKEELGEFTPVGAEKYELNWAGKANAKRIAREDVLGRTLNYVPQDSKNADTTENLYIEGDNLEVLKLLRQNYYGAVKMIYIDPPYNTGSDKLYPDNFAMSEEESAEAEGETVDGKRMVVNQKSSNRFHARWLNIMYPRLKVARDLLTEDGVIFISIDDNEVDNLKEICNEVLGESNFISQIVWEKMYTTKNDSSLISQSHEYILAYSKNSGNSSINLLPRTAEMNARYSNPDNDPRGVWKPIPLYGKGERKNGRYPVISPITGKQYLPANNSHWLYRQIDTEKMINENRIYFGKDGNSQPNIKRFLTEVQQGTKAKSLWKYSEVGSNDSAKRELKDLYENNIIPFDFPKPTTLIEQMLRIASNNQSIVLDFFSGSATTAHAVMQLNAEDGGNRKFIMVQVPEVCDEKSEAYKAGYKNICEIGKERIRRAGEKIKADIEEQNAQQKLGEEPKQVPDIGFKVFRTADTNIRWTHEALKVGQIHVEESMLSDKDKLDFMPGFKDLDVVYEVLLRQRDVPLSAKVKKRNEIGKRTYLIADTYLVCLEESITKDMLEKLAAVEPLPIKYILRDSAFEDNISLKDETVRRLEALIARNAGDNEQTYTVEFI